MIRERRSAKQVVENYANELMARHHDKDVDVKLLVIETIAHRMSWNDLYNKIKFRKRSKVPYWVEY